MIDAVKPADVEEVKHGEWKTTVSTVLHNNGEQSTYYGCRCTVCKEDADKSFSSALTAERVWTDRCKYWDVV